MMNQVLYDALYKEVSQTLPQFTQNLDISIQEGIKNLLVFLESAPLEPGNEQACSAFCSTLCDIFAYRAAPVSIGTKIEPLFRAMTHTLNPKKSSLFHYIEALAVLDGNENKISNKTLPEGWEGTIHEDFFILYLVRNNESHYAKYYTYAEQAMFLQRLCRVLCFIAMKRADLLNPLYAHDIRIVQAYLNQKENDIHTLSELHSFLGDDYGSLHEFCQNSNKNSNIDWLYTENKQYSHAKHCAYITLWALGMYVKLTNDTNRYAEIDYSFEPNNPEYVPLYAIPAILCAVNTPELILKNQFITELPPEIAGWKNTVIDLTNNQVHQLPIELGQYEDGPTIHMAGNPMKELPSELKHIESRIRFMEQQSQRISIEEFHDHRQMSSQNTASKSVLNMEEYRNKNTPPK